MNSSLKALLKVQFLNFWGINKTIHSKDKKDKNNKIYIMIVWIILLAYFIFISCAFGVGTVQLGMGSTVLPLCFLLTNIVVLIFSFFRSNTILKIKDFDMILSLPVKIEDIISSRMAIVYIQSLIATFICMLPTYIIYGASINANIMYYALLAISIFFVPILPLIISFLFAFLVSSLATKFRFKKSISLVLNLAFLILVFGGVYFMNTTSETDLQNVFTTLSDKISRVYPVANFYSDSISNINILSILLFIILSSVLFWAFLKILKAGFVGLNERLTASTKNKKYNLNKSKKDSQLMRLTKNEFKRYSNHTTWIINTCFPIILSIGLGILLLAVSPDQMIMSLISSDAIIDVSSADILQVVQLFIVPLMPLLVSLFVSVSPTSYASISIEGQSLWIIQSLPINKKVIFNSKILMNIILMLPSTLFVCTAAIISFKLDFLDALITLLLPLIFILFSSISGVYFNFKYSNFDWQNETEIVKRGGAVFATMITSFILCIVMTALLFLTSFIYYQAIEGAYIILLFITSILLYNKVCKKELIELSE